MSFLATNPVSGGMAAGSNPNVSTATGDKQFNIGGNPNVRQALTTVPLMLGIAAAAAVGLWLWSRRKR